MDQVTVVYWFRNRDPEGRRETGRLEWEGVKSARKGDPGCVAIAAFKWERLSFWAAQLGSRMMSLLPPSIFHTIGLSIEMMLVMCIVRVSQRWFASGLDSRLRPSEAKPQCQ